MLPIAYSLATQQHSYTPFIPSIRSCGMSLLQNTNNSNNNNNNSTNDNGNNLFRFKEIILTITNDHDNTSKNATGASSKNREISKP